MSVNIVPRTRWGARLPKATKPLEEPVKFVTVQWTDTEPCKDPEECCKVVKDIQEDHIRRKGYNDIAFNFLVAGDGNVYEGRGWGVLPMKLEKYDQLFGKSISVGQIGRNGTIPPNELADLVRSFISYGTITNHITKSIGLYPDHGL